MLSILSSLLFGLDVNHAKQDAIHALQDSGVVVETRGLEAWDKKAAEGFDLSSPLTYTLEELDGPPRLVIQGLKTPPHALWTNGNLLYISRALRDALNLDAAVVDYVAIDDSESDLRIQSMDYRIAQFLIVEDAIDPERSVQGSWEDIGGPGFDPGLPPPFRKVTLYSNFVPSHDVFGIAGINGLYTTDALRARLEGFDDLQLFDPGIIDQD